MLHHILIIEDDTAVAQSLQDGLQQAGYTTTWHDHGQTGVQFARDHHPHLILLDLRLPDGSGLDFCRQLRQLKLNQPIIMLSVQGEEMDKVLGLEMGADDYLTKPYSLRELLSRIRANLRRAYGELATTDSDQLYINDIVIDLGRGKVERGQQTLNLTPTEFRLLIFLARNPNQALSRAQILRTVWEDGDGIENERTVNVHIRRLREKVELTPSQPTLILTVPGIGYRLAAS